MPLDHPPPPPIVRIDEKGIGYDRNGQGYTPVLAGIGTTQNGPYSVIITYTPPPPTK